MTPRRGVWAMVLATLMWGGTFVMIRDIVVAVPPLVLVAVRFALAGAIFLLVALLRRSPAPDRAPWIGGVLSGVAMAGGYAFQAIGLTTTSAGSSAFLTCAGTLLAGGFAWPLLGQRPSRTLALGLLTAGFGAALLTLHAGWSIGPGDAWTLLGATSFALQVVALGRWAPGSDPLVLAAVQCATVAAIMLPFALPGAHAIGPLIAGLGALDRLRLLYLVIAASLIAPLLQILAQRTLPPGRVGLLFALEPVFALTFAVALGGERFVVRWWAGAALILVAVVLVERRAATSPTAT